MIYNTNITFNINQRTVVLSIIGERIPQNGLKSSFPSIILNYFFKQFFSLSKYPAVKYSRTYRCLPCNFLALAMTIIVGVTVLLSSFDNRKYLLKNLFCLKIYLKCYYCSHDGPVFKMAPRLKIEDWNASIYTCYTTYSLSWFLTNELLKFSSFSVNMS